MTERTMIAALSIAVLILCIVCGHLDNKLDGQQQTINRLDLETTKLYEHADLLFQHVQALETQQLAKEAQ